MKSFLFYRDFVRASGGHQKVFDYFRHVQIGSHRASIAFSAETIWDQSNPWYPNYRHQAVPFAPSDHDYLFLAGVDWLAYQKVGVDPAKPVINLIQHVRHAEPRQPMNPFLTEKAIRICVSRKVEEAIVDTGIVNGPTFVIENGLELPEIVIDKSTDLFIAGMKRPGLGGRIADYFANAGLKVDLVSTRIPRAVFLRRLAAARIALMLPTATEGFYLPGLEAMQYADLAVVPDCVGNRDFCIDAIKDVKRGNCYVPTQNVEDIRRAVDNALAVLDQPVEQQMVKNNALATVAAHSLDRERQAFLDLVSRVDQLWQTI